MLLKSLRPLLPYLRRYRSPYIAGTLCVFLTNGIWILFPLVIGRAADDLHNGVTRHKFLVYAGNPARPRHHQRNIPVPDALDGHRHFPRHRIRSAQ